MKPRHGSNPRCLKLRRLKIPNRNGVYCKYTSFLIFNNRIHHFELMVKIDFLYLVIINNRYIYKL
jgi:hypothetical protein